MVIKNRGHDLILGLLIIAFGETAEICVSQDGIITDNLATQLTRNHKTRKLFMSEENCF